MSIFGSLQNIIVLLVAGLVGGILADYFVKGAKFGLLGELIIGVIGALIASAILGAIGFSSNGLVALIIVSFLGAVLLLWIIKLLRKR